MRILSARLRRLTGVRVLDPSSGFRAIRRPLLDQFAEHYPVEYHTVAALIEAARTGAKVVEHPIITTPKAHDIESHHSIFALIRETVVVELLRRKGPPIIADLRVLSEI